MKFIKYLLKDSWRYIKDFLFEIILGLLFLLVCCTIIFGPIWLVSFLFSIQFEKVGAYYILLLFGITLIWLVIHLVYTFIKWLKRVRKEFKNEF